MKKKYRALSIMIITGLTACAIFSITNMNSKKPAIKDQNNTEEPGIVTLKLFTALADRKNGQGKIEQQIIDAYMKEHRNVKIEVEALQDEPYKSKVKIYATSNALPDIIQSWGQTSFIKPLIDAGLLAKLNESDYTSYHFVSGSLDGFKQHGELYGLPRNTDFFVMYYNQKILADTGIAVPGTTQEWFKASKMLRERH